MTTVYTKNLNSKVEKIDSFENFDFSHLRVQCLVRKIVGGDYEIKRLWEEFNISGHAQGLTSDDKIITWSNR